jgi:hypothetical protein
MEEEEGANECGQHSLHSLLMELRFAIFRHGLGSPKGPVDVARV